MRFSSTSINYYVLTSSLFLSTAFAFVAASSRCSSSATSRLLHAAFSTRGGSSLSASTTSAYDNLVEHLKGITHLNRASAVLSYDQMVFMPQTDAAGKARGEQSAALAAVIHEKSISPKLGEYLQQASVEVQQQDDDGDYKSRVIALAQKAYDKKTKIPTPLASKSASLSAEAYQTWTKARSQDDFSLFADILAQGIDVAKQVASATQTDEEKAANKSLYATMLDEYEVGMDPQRIDAVFEDIQQALVPLIAKVFSDDTAAPDTAVLKGDFPIPSQEALSKHMVRTIGFEDEKGRIDVSVHPFSSGISKHDVRITSRFSETEWYQGLAGSMHEAGHAMYEQNVGDSGLPIDAALSMGMHESQSLFWERHVGLSKAFWEYATPIVKEHLNIVDSDAATSETLYRAVNAATRSLIRVEADELTYPLHVILRYRMERDFVDGKLDVKDIPSRWNAGMKDLLNVEVPSDAQGCLQDVHWSMLAYGYFPTYLIGAATAAQWAHYCQQDIPDWDEKVSKGDFAEIKAWMTEKVHKHGSHYASLDEHLEAQVGEPLNPKYFIEYLTEKYSDLYQC